MSLIWWEKTVEYYFVKNYLEDIDIAPFDGNIEKIGDALAHKNGKMLLIEFKKSYSDLGTEKSKYKNWNEVVNTIRQNNPQWLNNDFHILVFGGNKSGKFELNSHKYWKIEDETASIEGIFYNKNSFKEYVDKNGVCKRDFDEYADFLFSKKSDASGGDKLKSHVLDNCAVITKINDKYTSVSFGEYAVRCLSKEIKQDQSISINRRQNNQRRGMGFGL